MIDWELWLQPVRISIQAAVCASVIVMLLGTLTAWVMLRLRSGKLIVETILLLPLVLPPTAVGFILLLLLGRQSWIGQLVERITSAPLLFTWWAAVIASVVVAFPLVYQTMKAGFSGVDRQVIDAAKVCGAGELQLLRFIVLPLAARSIVAAYILGFARSLGEFGATLMIAGNIPGKTQTLPIAVYTAVEAGELRLAWTWTGSMVMMSFVLLLIARGWERRSSNSSF